MIQVSDVRVGESWVRVVPGLLVALVAVYAVGHGVAWVVAAVVGAEPVSSPADVVGIAVAF